MGQGVGVGGTDPTSKITSGYKTSENLVRISLEKQLAPRGRSLAKGPRARGSITSRGRSRTWSPRARGPIASRRRSRARSPRARGRTASRGRSRTKGLMAKVHLPLEGDLGPEVLGTNCFSMEI